MELASRSEPELGPTTLMTHRPLTAPEAVCLHEELRSTPNILGYTVQEIMRFKDVFVAECEGEFGGVCVSKDLLFGWTDIAVLYVLPTFRARGIGKQLYTAAWNRAQERERHMFTLSRNASVLQMMEEFGMQMSCSMWNAPLAVHLHMNRHMMSMYRFRESIRKSKEMRGSLPLRSGTRRHTTSRKPLP